MLYHYTTLSALQGILRDAATTGKMCFWATRYDCFADEEEYKLGVETIRRLLPAIEKEFGLPEDRCLAKDFDWDMISGNANLGYPYIVSLTARKDNGYMWAEYAKGEGVVLEIDGSEFVPNEEMTAVASRPCVYADLVSDEELTEQIRQDYTSAGAALLTGPMKDLAFGMLKEYPQLFVRLIGVTLLAFTASRIKGKEFCSEEETRIIISSQAPVVAEYVNTNRDIIRNVLHLNPDELIRTMQNEKIRQRNGKDIFYRDFFLPVDKLRAVYTREDNKEKVANALARLGLGDLPVMPTQIELSR